MTNATQLTVWRANWEFYEGLTQEQIEADDFDWDDFSSECDTRIVTAHVGQDQVYEDAAGDPIPSGFIGVARLIAVKEAVEVPHTGNFDITKLDCTGDQVTYDGHEFEAYSSSPKSEEVMAFGGPDHPGRTRVRGLLDYFK